MTSHHEEIEKIRRKIEEVTDIIELENGLKIITEHVPNAPGMLKGDLFIDFGAKDENPGEDGAAHFFEHMCFNGTRKYPSRKELDRNMRLLGDRLNASTNRYRIFFPFNHLERDLELTLDIITQMAFDPIFTQEAFEREREIILNERENRFKNPINLAYEWSWQNFIKNFPLSHTVIGTPETLREMKLETLASYMSKFMVPNTEKTTQICLL